MKNYLMLNYLLKWVSVGQLEVTYWWRLMYIDMHKYCNGDEMCYMYTVN